MKTIDNKINSLLIIESNKHNLKEEVEIYLSLKHEFQKEKESPTSKHMIVNVINKVWYEKWKTFTNYKKIKSLKNQLSHRSINLGEHREPSISPKTHLVLEKADKEAGNKSNSHPGKISNEELLIENAENIIYTCEQSSKSQHNMLKENEKSKFKIISPKIWEFLYSIYSGGPEITRRCIIPPEVTMQSELVETPKRGKNIIYDLFYKLVKVYIVLKIDEKLEETQTFKGKVMHFACSQYQSICQFKRSLVELTIDKNQTLKQNRNKIRIYFRLWKLQEEENSLQKLQDYLKGKQNYLANNIALEFPGELIDLYPCLTIEEAELDSEEIVVCELLLRFDKLRFSPIFKIDMNLHIQTGTCSNSRCRHKKPEDRLLYTCICHKVWFCSEFCAVENEEFHKDSCDLTKFYSVEDFKVHETKDSIKSKAGIKNIGNTCYMNTALQCLSNIPELANYFLTDIFKDDVNRGNPLGSKGVIAFHFAKIIKQLHFGKENCIIIHQFKKIVAKLHPHFRGYAQEDSQEFLTYLLDTLHEDLNKVKIKPYIEQPVITHLPDEEAAAVSFIHYLTRNQSVIVELFVGQFKSTLTCLKCKTVNSKFDPFLCLSLPIPVQNTINVTIYIVYFDISKGILKLTVPVNVNSEIIHLRKKIGKLLNMHHMSFLLGSLVNTEIERIYNNLHHITGDDINTIFFAYQIDPKLFNSSENKNKNSRDNNRNSKMFPKILSETKSHTDEGESESPSMSPTIESGVNSFAESALSLEMGVDSICYAGVSSYYTDIDDTYVENYNMDFQFKSDGESTPNNMDRIDLNELTSKLLIYTDDNYGFPGNYIKTSVKFTCQDLNSNNTTGILPKHFLMNSRISIGFQRIIYLNSKWTLKKTQQYLTDNIINSYQSVLLKNSHSHSHPHSNESNLFSDDANIYSSILPEIRIVNINRNKHRPCVVCRKTCDNCLMSNYSNFENSTLEEVLALYPKNKSGNTIDNNYLYLDPAQRRICVSKRDFELEIVIQNNTSTSVSPIINRNRTCMSVSANKIATKFPFAAFMHKLLTNTVTWKSQNSSYFMKDKKKEVTLSDCFAKFSQIELLEENDACYCATCKAHYTARKKIEIWKAPPVLIIQLKRFTSESHQKVENFVDFPINLDLRKFLFHREKSISYKYDLYCITNHTGNVTNGHYFAYCKNPYDGKWYKYDDTNVSEIDQSNLVTNAAYVLFYKRKENGITHSNNNNNNISNNQVVADTHEMTNNNVSENTLNILNKEISILENTNNGKCVSAQLEEIYKKPFVNYEVFLKTCNKTTEKKGKYNKYNTNLSNKFEHSQTMPKENLSESLQGVAKNLNERFDSI